MYATISNASIDFHEGRIFAGYYGFNGNISFTFQAVKDLSAHLTSVFVNVWVIFERIWG